MKKVFAGIVFLLTVGCQENETLVDDFTGNEVVYSLQSGSVYPISGTATFKEMKDGNTVIAIELTGTEGNIGSAAGARSSGRSEISICKSE